MNLENLGVQEMSAQEVKNVDGGGMNDRPFGQSDDFGHDGSSAGSSRGSIAPRQGIISAAFEILWEKMWN